MPDKTLDHPRCRWHHHRCLSGDRRSFCTTRHDIGRGTKLSKTSPPVQVPGRREGVPVDHSQKHAPKRPPENCWQFDRCVSGKGPPLSRHCRTDQITDRSAGDWPEIVVGLVTRNITNAPLETLRQLFARHDIDVAALDFFDHVPLSEGKTAQFRVIRERFNINPARAFICGDEYKDYLAAISTGRHASIHSFIHGVVWFRGLRPADGKICGSG